MSDRHPRFLPVVRSKTWSFTIERDDASYTPRVITIPDANNYDIGDDSSVDLPKIVEDLVRAHAEFGAGPEANFQAAIDTSTGIFSMSLGTATTTATITWGAGGTALRDHWRLPETSTQVLTAPTLVSGAGVVFGGFYPSHMLMSDLPDRVPVQRHLLSTQGRSQTLHLAMHVQRRISVVYQGSERKAVEGEWHQYDRFMASVQGGAEWRMYPDKTIFVEKGEGASDPWGYQTWTLHEDSRIYRPAPLNAGSYVQFKDNRRLRAYVPAS